MATPTRCEHSGNTTQQTNFNSGGRAYGAAGHMLRLSAPHVTHHGVIVSLWRAGGPAVPVSSLRPLCTLTSRRTWASPSLLPPPLASSTHSPLHATTAAWMCTAPPPPPPPSATPPSATPPSDDPPKPHSSRRGLAVVKQVPDAPVSVFRRVLDNVQAFTATFKRYAAEYKNGFVLLRREVSLALRLVYKFALGHRWKSRSEQRLLKQTAANMLKVLPLASFVMTMGFTLTSTVVVRVFPRLLPSTFKGVEELTRQGTRKEAADRKMAIAERIRVLTGETADTLHQNETIARNDAAEVHRFLQRLKNKSAHISNEDIMRLAPVFRRSIPFERLPRAQLYAMCEYLNLWRVPLLPKGFLVFQLRTTARTLRSDDKDILIEGVHSLSDEDVEEACTQRGLTRGLHETAPGVLRARLSSWVNLSVSKDVPSSLLILVGAFKTSHSHVEDQGPSAIDVKIEMLETQLDHLQHQRDSLAAEIEQLTDHLEYCRQQQTVVDTARGGEGTGAGTLELVVASGAALPRLSLSELPPATADKLAEAFHDATGMERVHLSVDEAQECLLALVPGEWQVSPETVRAAVVDADAGVRGLVSMGDFIGAYAALCLAHDEATAGSWEGKADAKRQALERLEELDRLLAERLEEEAEHSSSDTGSDDDTTDVVGAKVAKSKAHADA